MTIFGLNFGALYWSTTTTATLPSALCGSSFWLSDSSIQCQSPGGLGTKTSTVLTIGGMVGTGSTSFSYDGTERWSVARQRGLLPIPAVDRRG